MVTDIPIKLITANYIINFLMGILQFKA